MCWKMEYLCPFQLTLNTVKVATYKMEMEYVVDRLKTRHSGHEGMVDLLKVNTSLILN